VAWTHVPVPLRGIGGTGMNLLPGNMIVVGVSVLVTGFAWRRPGRLRRCLVQGGPSLFVCARREARLSIVGNTSIVLLVVIIIILESHHGQGKATQDALGLHTLGGYAGRRPLLLLFHVTVREDPSQATRQGRSGRFNMLLLGLVFGRRNAFLTNGRVAALQHGVMKMMLWCRRLTWPHTTWLVIGVGRLLLWRVKCLSLHRVMRMLLLCGPGLP
jgi:hypothetical protein